jgi:hypothetical protein
MFSLVSVVFLVSLVNAPQAPLQAPVVPKPLFGDVSPARSCESLAGVTLADTTIESAVVDPGDARTPSSCRVTATVTNPPAGDRIKVWV